MCSILAIPASQINTVYSSKGYDMQINRLRHSLVEQLDIYKSAAMGLGHVKTQVIFDDEADIQVVAHISIGPTQIPSFRRSLSMSFG
ncbi:MAG: hypothetical protein JSU65_03995, partial [Candidatus Zixiibacteriota bacterium]